MRRRGRGPLLGVVPLLAGLVVAPPSAHAAQPLERNVITPDVVIERVVRPYSLDGETAAEIDAQLQALARGTSWVRFAHYLRWTLSYDRYTTLSGGTSNLCRVEELGFRFLLTGSFPEWRAPDGADGSVRAAWEAFEEELEAQWRHQEDRARQVTRRMYSRARRLEEPCDFITDRVRVLLDETTDEVWEESRTPENRPPPLRWPPPGHESVMVAPPSESATAEVTRGRDLPARSGPAGAPLDSDPPADDSEPPSDEAATGPLGEAAARDLETVDGLILGLSHEGSLRFLDTAGGRRGIGQPLDTAQAVPFPGLAGVMVSFLASSLEAAGLLDVDGPVSGYLPDVSPDQAGRSLRALLHEGAPSAAELALAVRALEARLGRSLEAALAEVYFRPLGMESASLVPVPGPAAPPQLRSTAPEVIRFLDAWLQGRLPGAGGVAPGLTVVEGEGPRRLLLRCVDRGGGTSLALDLFPATRSVFLAWSAGLPGRDPEELWAPNAAGLTLQALVGDLGAPGGVEIPPSESVVGCVP